LDKTENHEDISKPTDVELPPEMAAVFAYWQSLRAGRVAPVWREFDFFALPSHLIPWCAVVDVTYDPIEFTYRFLAQTGCVFNGQITPSTGSVRSRLTIWQRKWLEIIWFWSMHSNLNSFERREKAL